MVYAYLRGWSVRLNKKKGEENTDILYTWVGDVVRGHFFSPSTINRSYIDEDQESNVSLTLGDEELDHLTSVEANVNREHSTVDIENSSFSTSAEANVTTVQSTVDTEHSSFSTSAEANVDISCIMPDPRLETLVQLHITLVDVFKDVGLCTMPAP